MLLFILAYVGGMLTILSPCVLPVIPFLFSRSNFSFHKSGLPTLVGMALSFTLFGVLSAAGGDWVIHANEYGRYFAILVFAILGLTLLFPGFAQRLFQPIVNLGGRLQQRAMASDGIASSLLVGASVGLLWAPCAGPILGLVLAGAALGGFTSSSFALLAAFAAGAATSLGVAIFASGKFINKLKKGLGAEELIKKALGVLVLLSVVGIAFGLDTRLLAKFSYLNTNKIEQKLIEVTGTASKQSHELKSEGTMPPLDGAVAWLNSEPLTAESLKGKVVLVDFWTYSCINCLRTLPYLKAWSDKYAAQGLVVIGIHAPEFAFERKTSNVEAAVKDLGITYPVAVDSKLNIWNAFKNQYWPAHYFIDATGQIRYHHFGEGNYEESERVIQKLLKEAHPSGPVVDGVVAGSIQGQGLQHESGIIKDIANPETYLGYERQAYFAEAEGLVKDSPKNYSSVGSLSLKQWSLDGNWRIGAEMIQSQEAGSKISIRFRARDLHLVLANPEGQSVRFRVRLDGKAPEGSRGEDIDAAGEGTIQSERLYQLIRQDLPVGQAQVEHLFEIEFLDPGAEAFAFTFG